MKNNLRAVRQSNNLTQEDLALELKVSRQTINAIETFRYLPSLPLALKLAAYFKLSVEEMFEIEDGD
jgi:putative transcriptional regulator